MLNFYNVRIVESHSLMFLPFQVPSGLAASGSLVAGLISAEQITGNASGISVINNGTQGFVDASNSTNSTGADTVYSGTIFDVHWYSIRGVKRGVGFLRFELNAVTTCIGWYSSENLHSKALEDIYP
jgi:hypothetical protein